MFSKQPPGACENMNVKVCILASLLSTALLAASAPTASAIYVCGDSQDDVDVNAGAFVCIDTSATPDTRCAVVYIDDDNSGSYSSGDTHVGPCNA